MVEAEAMVDRYKQPDGVMVREVANELVLVNTATERYFALDATGRLMYEMLVSGTPVEDVVDRVVDATDGALPETVRSHLDGLIQRLCASALLEAA